MTNKAFIFDMDGVIVNSERLWQTFEKPMLAKVLGEEIASQIESTVGLNASQVFEIARALGSQISFEKLHAEYLALEPDIYAQAEITAGVGDLIYLLLAKGFKVGLVTQSAGPSIDFILARFPEGELIERTISLFQHPELRPKPSPDGYVRMLQELESEPTRSMILEDSNTGILSAKAARAFVIGYQENLVDGYSQTGADAYARTMKDVQQFIKLNVLP